jgi:hypothetical protein
MSGPIMQSALAGIATAANDFDRAAARVTRLASLPVTELGDSVSISPAARALQQSSGSPTTLGLEGAIVDTRVAKYAFIANLRVLQTAADMAADLNKLGQRS